MGRLTDEIDSQQRQFGTGWICGVLALALAVLGLGAVLCFCYPQILTVDAARDFYADNLNVIRLILHLVLITAFVLALLSAILRKSPYLGFVAMAIVLVATLMGGLVTPWPRARRYAMPGANPGNQREPCDHSSGMARSSNVRPAKRSSTRESCRYQRRLNSHPTSMRQNAQARDRRLPPRNAK